MAHVFHYVCLWFLQTPAHKAYLHKAIRLTFTPKVYIKQSIPGVRLLHSTVLLALLGLNIQFVSNFKVASKAQNLKLACKAPIYKLAPKAQKVKLASKAQTQHTCQGPKTHACHCLHASLFCQGSQTWPHMKRHAEVQLSSLEKSSKDWKDGDLDYLIEQAGVVVCITVVSSI